MPKSGLFIYFSLSILISFYLLPIPIYGQSLPVVKSSLKNIYDVSASVTLQVRNETLSGVLTPAILNLINSGAGIFKTSESDKLVMKTTVDNQINNVTQNVQGVDGG